MDTTEIQQAIAPLIRSMDQLYGQMQRIADRFDALPGTYMPRLEYEARHKALVDEIADLRVYVDQFKDSVEKHQKALEEKQRSALGNKIMVWLAACGWIIAILSVVLGHFLK